jgi:Lar family restriction alleviation protein
MTNNNPSPVMGGEQTDELKPCPFCGGEPKVVLDESNDRYYVECTKCMAGSKAVYNVKDDGRPHVIAAWNERVPPTPVEPSVPSVQGKEDGGASAINSGEASVASHSSGVGNSVGTFQDQSILMESHGHGNCLQAAVASIIGFPLDTVPNFVLFEKWFERMEEFLTCKGFAICDEPDDDEIVLAFGNSPRGFKHAVVMRGDELLHDPHPSRGGVSGVYWKAALRKPPQAPDVQASVATGDQERTESPDNKPSTLQETEGEGDDR